MILKKFYGCVFSICCFFSSAVGQVYIELGPKGRLSNAEVMVYGPDATPKPIPYNTINGSPFWNPGWQPAALYSHNKPIGIVPARLNLATNEVHFLKDGQELVVTPDNNLTAIRFYTDRDTTAVTAVFEKQLLSTQEDSSGGASFMQVLTTGSYELLKYIKRTVTTQDSLFGTQKRYVFKDIVLYFLKSDMGLQRLKKFNETSIFGVAPALAKYKAWIEKNNINLKKEADAVRFFNYCNAQHG